MSVVGCSLLTKPCAAKRRITLARTWLRLPCSVIISSHTRGLVVEAEILPTGTGIAVGHDAGSRIPPLWLTDTTEPPPWRPRPLRSVGALLPVLGLGLVLVLGIVLVLV